MIIPNKINPIGYQKLNSFKFRLFHDGGGGGQNYIIDNNTYIIYAFGTIYLNSVSYPDAVFTSNDVLIGNNPVITFKCALPCAGDYIKVYSSEDELNPIYEKVFNNSSWSTYTFTLPPISSQYCYLIHGYCND